MRQRVRMFVGLLAVLEVLAFVLVASWIGVGWTILAMLATSGLGGLLLARLGTRALGELRDRARSRQPAGRELGNAGLVAAGGLLMVLPGFVGDLLGLLCLLPGTRDLVRKGLAGLVFARLPEHVRGPVRVTSARTEEVAWTEEATRERPLVIEGEVLREDPGDRPAR